VDRWQRKGHWKASEYEAELEKTFEEHKLVSSGYVRNTGFRRVGAGDEDYAQLFYICIGVLKLF
jgi:hypothetical protein